MRWYLIPDEPASRNRKLWIMVITILVWFALQVAIGVLIGKMFDRGNQ